MRFVTSLKQRVVRYRFVCREPRRGHLRIRLHSRLVTRRRLVLFLCDAGRIDEDLRPVPRHKLAYLERASCMAYPNHDSPKATVTDLDSVQRHGGSIPRHGQRCSAALSPLRVTRCDIERIAGIDTTTSRFVLDFVLFFWRRSVPRLRPGLLTFRRDPRSPTGPGRDTPAAATQSEDASGCVALLLPAEGGVCDGVAALEGGIP